MIYILASVSELVAAESALAMAPPAMDVLTHSSGPAAGAALKESVAPSDEMVESEGDGVRNTSAAALPASVSELVAAKSALAMAPPARDVLTHAGPRSSNWRSETRRATGVVPKARTCGGAARSSSAQSQRPA